MPMQYDIFYADEAERFLWLKDKRGRFLTAMGAGLGIKDGSIKLLDWCGILYYPRVQQKNGNGYWYLLGQQFLELLEEYYSKYEPSKIYICEQIGIYVEKAMKSNGIDRTKIIPEGCIERINRHCKKRNASAYKAKEEVGWSVKKCLHVELSEDILKEVLKGMAYDIKSKNCFKSSQSF